MISSITVSAKKKVKKKRPSRCLARIQKKIRLGRLQVSRISVLMVTGPSHISSAKLASRRVMTITPDAKATLREITDKFGVDLNEGVPEAFHAVMPPQWHVYYDVPASERHAVTMTYTVE